MKMLWGGQYFFSCESAATLPRNRGTFRKAACRIESPRQRFVFLSSSIFVDARGSGPRPRAIYNAARSIYTRVRRLYVRCRNIYTPARGIYLRCRNGYMRTRGIYTGCRGIYMRVKSVANPF
jgi:hypothetical protein